MVGNPGDKKSIKSHHIITVKTNDIDFLFDMELWNNFTIEDSNDKMELIDNIDKKDEDLADKILSDLEDKGELLCIEVRRTKYHREITLIERWMRQYFQAITLDEGIYPEILFPIPENKDYKPKPEKSFIKKFSDWLIR